MINFFYLLLILSLNAYSSEKKVCISRQELIARSPGIVESFLVQNGTQVKVGTPIILLDNRIQKAAAKEAQGALELAKAQLDLAEDTKKRLENLKNSESISEQQKFEAHIRTLQARAQLKQAEGAYQRIQAQLEDTTIRARMPGVVKGLPSMIGMFVQPGLTLGRIEMSELPSECQPSK